MDPISIILLVFVGIVALLLVGIVLIQNEQSDGLGGIFGGGSSNQIGNRKGNILTRTTAILGTIFLSLCFLLALINHKPTPDASSVNNANKNGEQTGPYEWFNPKAAGSAIGPLASPAASGQPGSAQPGASTQPGQTAQPAAAPSAQPSSRPGN